jgi:hypothetical protein
MQDDSEYVEGEPGCSFGVVGASLGVPSHDRALSESDASDEFSAA